VRLALRRSKVTLAFPLMALWVRRHLRNWTKPLGPQRPQQPPQRPARSRLMPKPSQPLKPLRRRLVWETRQLRVLRTCRPKLKPWLPALRMLQRQHVVLVRRSAWVSRMVCTPGFRMLTGRFLLLYRMPYRLLVGSHLLATHRVLLSGGRSWKVLLMVLLAALALRLRGHSKRLTLL